MKRFGSSPSTPAARKAAAIAIRQHPDHWQLCLGCGSIVARVAGACPLCNGYRFDSSAETVRGAALALAAKKPEPLRSHKA